MEIVDIFYGRLEYFTDVWDIFWAFGTFTYCSFGTFYSGFGIMYQERSGNPAEGVLLFLIRAYFAHKETFRGKKMVFVRLVLMDS
jgi:hypothetical protein